MKLKLGSNPSKVPGFDNLGVYPVLNRGLWQRAQPVRRLLDFLVELCGLPLVAMRLELFEKRRWLQDLTKVPGRVFLFSPVLKVSPFRLEGIPLNMNHLACIFFRMLTLRCLMGFTAGVGRTFHCETHQRAFGRLVKLAKLRSLSLNFGHPRVS